MCILIGALVGVAINHLIIKPIEERHYRELCIRDGLANANNAIK